MTSPDKALDGNLVQILVTLRPKCNFFCAKYSLSKFIFGINPSIFAFFSILQVCDYSRNEPFVCLKDNTLCDCVFWMEPVNKINCFHFSVSSFQDIHPKISDLSKSCNIHQHFNASNFSICQFDCWRPPITIISPILIVQSSRIRG